MSFRTPTKLDRQHAKARRVESRKRFIDRVAAEAQLASFLFVGSADGPLSNEETSFMSATFPAWDGFPRVTRDTVARKVRTYMLSCAPTLSERRRLRFQLLRFASCDGAPSSVETAALREIEGFLNLSPETRATGRQRWSTRRKSTFGGQTKIKAKPCAKAAAPPPLHWSYEYLGCSESDSDETIKRCYRQLAVKLHPDKHAARLKTPEDAVLHIRAFQTLQAAYAEVWRLRGKAAPKR